MAQVALALVTLALACVGVLGSKRLGTLVSYLVVMSVGTLVAALAFGQLEALGPALYPARLCSPHVPTTGKQIIRNGAPHMCIFFLFGSIGYLMVYRPSRPCFYLSFFA